MLNKMFTIDHYLRFKTCVHLLLTSKHQVQTSSWKRKDLEVLGITAKLQGTKSRVTLQKTWCWKLAGAT